jgi:hypothetical protein
VAALAPLVNAREKGPEPLEPRSGSPTPTDTEEDQERS